MSKQAQLPEVKIGDRQHPGAGRRKGRIKPRGRGAAQEALDEIRKLIGERPHERRRLIDYLHIIQDEFGCLSHRHMAALAREMELSQAQVHEVASFYSQFIIVPEGEKAADITLRVCDSLACSMKGADDLLEKCKQHFGEDVSVVKAPCMGRCDCAPVASANKRHIDHASVDEIEKVIEAGDLKPVIPDYKGFDDYITDGGYSLLQACLDGKYERQQIIDMLSDSSLRGLGGAGYPTGRKWATVLKLPKPKIIAVNFDESEMGTYKDRFFVEQDPHRLLEGIWSEAMDIVRES